MSGTSIRRIAATLLCLALLYFAAGGSFLHEHKDGPETVCHVCQSVHAPALTTKSGLGVTTPTGSVTASYGSFGTANLGFDVAYGGQKWEDFFAGNGLKNGRFLDPPSSPLYMTKGTKGTCLTVLIISCRKKTPSNTVLRISYARTLETPFNENLVISSTGCNDPVIS